MAIQRVKTNMVVDDNLTGVDIKDNTIESIDIKDGTITNVDISDEAKIDTKKIDWATPTFQNVSETITKTIINENYSLPGIFYQSYELDDSNSFTSVDSPQQAFVNHFYLPYPITVNYFNYILYSGGSSYKVRVGLYDCNGNMLWDSGNQSAASNIYKIPAPSLQLTPNVYYLLFATSDAPTRFASNAYKGNKHSVFVVPQRGIYMLEKYSWTAIPSNLNLSNIISNNWKQPWFALSKY
jgi:hypothetical protein